MADRLGPPVGAAAPFCAGPKLDVDEVGVTPDVPAPPNTVEATGNEPTWPSSLMKDGWMRFFPFFELIEMICGVGSGSGTGTFETMAELAGATDDRGTSWLTVMGGAGGSAIARGAGCGREL